MVEKYIQDTQRKLNKLAKQGWKVICSYGKYNIYLILAREESQ